MLNANIYENRNESINENEEVPVFKCNHGTCGALVRLVKYIKDDRAPAQLVCMNGHSQMTRIGHSDDFLKREHPYSVSRITLLCKNCNEEVLRTSSSQRYCKPCGIQAKLDNVKRQNEKSRLIRLAERAADISL